jgi:hypothetical protein
MVERNQKRIKNLVVISALIAVILSVSTYAWFIGMKTVNVSSFDVQIKTTDSLALSIDGDKWSPTITINGLNYNTGAYTGNTNSWGGVGLIPMSTIGDMDLTVSRMKLYEKASLTSTPGGYRLLASRVHNYDKPTEQDGYVVFDLFVKNFSGPQYYAELNTLNEEALYLTNDSAVTVAADGVANTGIENSVRIAFAQIGRVIGTTTTQSTITGITCTTNSDVTGICRKAQIWEPNDLYHVTNAISWYNTSCLARTGADVTKSASYSGACETVINGKAYPTYAVSDNIVPLDNVNVYDGPAYNKYVAPGNDLLVSYPFFTDSMKLLTGTKRPQFITLAPNSITKVRVYIYIEGQDVDNYDFAQIGKSISIKFGFTKERYTEDDIDYTGPETNEGDGPSSVTDTTKPIITLAGTDPMTVTLGQTYNEPGVTSVSDNRDTTLTISDVVITGTVNVNVADSYTIVYTLTDASGNTATKTRTVIVQ